MVCPAGTAKQQGVHVPKVLRPYVGTDFLPFVREAKKAITSAAASSTVGAGDGASGVPSVDRLDAMLATTTFLKGAATHASVTHSAPERVQALKLQSCTRESCDAYFPVPRIRPIQDRC